MKHVDLIGSIRKMDTKANSNLTTPLLGWLRHDDQLWHQRWKICLFHWKRRVCILHDISYISVQEKLEKFSQVPKFPFKYTKLLVKNLPASSTHVWHTAKLEFAWMGKCTRFSQIYPAMTKLFNIRINACSRGSKTKKILPALLWNRCASYSFTIHMWKHHWTVPHHQLWVTISLMVAENLIPLRIDLISIAASV